MHVLCTGSIVDVMVVSGDDDDGAGEYDDEAEISTSMSVLRPATGTAVEQEEGPPALLPRLTGGDGVGGGFGVCAPTALAGSHGCSDSLFVV